MRPLILYSRPDCHLCERLLDELAGLGIDQAAVEIVDVDGDPELVRLYGLRIPVLAGGGAELSGYPLDRERVERFLAAADGAPR